MHSYLCSFVRFVANAFFFGFRVWDFILVSGFGFLVSFPHTTGFSLNTSVPSPYARDDEKFVAVSGQEGEGS